MRTGEHQGRAREHRIAATGDASSASVGRRRNRSGLTSEPAGNKYCRVRRNRPPSPASGAPPGAALIRGPSDSAVGAWKICSRSEATCRSRSSSVVALYAAFGFSSVVLLSAVFVRAVAFVRSSLLSLLFLRSSLRSSLLFIRKKTARQTGSGRQVSGAGGTPPAVSDLAGHHPWGAAGSETAAVLSRGREARAGGGKLGGRFAVLRAAGSRAGRRG